MDKSTTKTTAKKRGERIPSYRLHKRSGQGVVTLSGKDHYCGVHGKPASERRYRELVAAWLANNRQLPKKTKGDSEEEDDSLTIAELGLRFITWARQNYRKNGEPTDEVRHLESALRPVVEKFGVLSVNQFGPNALRSIREGYVANGWVRITVNAYVHKVRRMFRWGVSHELVKPEVVVALAAVDGLKRGRSEAKEGKPTAPVADHVLEKALVKANPWMRSALLVQRYTGMRAGEMLSMRPRDVDRSGVVWWYVPESHKTEHHGIERRIAIGPKAQEVLTPLLAKAAPDAPVFVVTGGKSRGRPMQPRPYALSLRRVCKRAGVSAFRPHQLRHARLTELRGSLGLDVAQAVGGHSNASMTARYARVHSAKAEQAAKESG